MSASANLAVGTISAATIAPVSLFGRPKTRASHDGSSAVIRSSTGSGWTLTPPTLMISDRRPEQHPSPHDLDQVARGPPRLAPGRRSSLVGLVGVAEHAGLGPDPQLPVLPAHWTWVRRAQQRADEMPGSPSFTEVTEPNSVDA